MQQESSTRDRQVSLEVPADMQCHIESGSEGANLQLADIDWNRFLAEDLRTCCILRHQKGNVEDHPKIDTQQLRVFSHAHTFLDSASFAVHRLAFSRNSAVVALRSALPHPTESHSASSSDNRRSKACEAACKMLTSRHRLLANVQLAAQ
eukprot:1322568-Amphidinium_carterae.1